VVLLAPAVLARSQLPGVAVAVVDASVALLPALAVRPGAGGIAPSDNRAAMERMGRDPLVLQEVRLDLVGGLLDLMDAAVAALPACCAVPVLVLSGGRDAVVPIRMQRRVLRGLPPREDRRVLYYPEGFHLLLRDNVRADVARDILAWMTNPSAPIAAEDAAREWLRQ
jgi:acylglycerol lipase